MSTLQLKDLAQKCLSMQAGVDQNAAYANFIAHVEPQEIVSLFERLEAAERERDELRKMLTSTQDGAAEAINHSLKLQAECEEAVLLRLEVSAALSIATRRYEKAEAELARRDAAAGEPLLNCSTRTTVAQQRIAELDDQSRIWQEQAHLMAVELRRRDAAASEPVGEVRLGDYDPDGIRSASVVCLHDQADWENFPDGTKLYTAAPPAVFPPASDASQGWKVNPEYLQSVANRSCDADGVNPSLETVESVILALGAQPQKVVDFSKCRTLWYDHDDLSAEVKCIPWRDVKAALDAANVPYEVKK